MTKSELLSMNDDKALFNELNKPENAELKKDKEITAYFFELAAKNAPQSNPDIVEDPRVYLRK